MRPRLASSHQLAAVCKLDGWGEGVAHGPTDANLATVPLAAVTAGLGVKRGTSGGTTLEEGLQPHPGEGGQVHVQ